MLNPLHQFEIRKLIHCEIGGIDVSFSNSSLFMILTVAFICVFLHLGTRKKRLIPNELQLICEMLFEFISKMIFEQIGKGGLKYVPYIFSFFIFILSANLIGLFPYSFTITSHIVVTFLLAFLVFLGITLIGIFKHGFKFFRTFFPSDVPIYIAPIVIPVEIISYLSKPISLSIRLFVNMVAGHIMLKVVASAAVFCALNSMLAFAVIPVGISMILMVFEIFVAMLQAYVFTILSCIYLNSVIHLH